MKSKGLSTVFEGLLLVKNRKATIDINKNDSKIESRYFRNFYMDTFETDINAID